MLSCAFRHPITLFDNKSRSSKPPSYSNSRSRRFISDEHDEEFSLASTLIVSVRSSRSSLSTRGNSLAVLAQAARVDGQDQRLAGIERNFRTRMMILLSSYLLILSDYSLDSNNSLHVKLVAIPSSGLKVSNLRSIVEGPQLRPVCNNEARPCSATPLSLATTRAKLFV